MNAMEVYVGSNGDATKALYERLEALGPAGFVAVNVFRACKCSERAKSYRGGTYKREAYGRKNWSLKNLCDALAEHGAELGIEWGWAEDTRQPVHKWVLYVETPLGQVSFHSGERLSQKNYLRQWDGTHLSAQRAVSWAQKLLNP